MVDISFIPDLDKPITRSNNDAFDAWVAETTEDGTPRYQKLYDSWYKHDNSTLEWQRYYWALRRAFEAGKQSVM